VLDDTDSEPGLERVACVNVGEPEISHLRHLNRKPGANVTAGDAGESGQPSIFFIFVCFILILSTFYFCFFRSTLLRGSQEDGRATAATFFPIRGIQRLPEFH
jgi:hypothetical protein